MEKSLVFHVHLKYNFCYGSISHKREVKKGSVWEHGGTFLAVQRLRLHASDTGGTSLNPAQGTKIPHAIGYGQINFKN